jgi:predicted DCC family thiol-disulfide oxidoreductase YuxK
MSADPTTPTISQVSATPGPSLQPASLNGISPGQSPVIFFDGVCGLCNHWIDFVAARDRNRLFRFAPLQGETARDWLHVDTAESLNSVVLLDGSGIHRKSDAVWRMLVQSGGVWRIFGWSLRLVPRLIRNWGYDFVARRRYRWFGKKETCRLPTPDERSRFLP